MTGQKRNIILFVDSFLILFLELALIRWISTEIRIFAYFQNLVLLACFIGGGLGCYLCEKKIRPQISLLMLGLIIFLIVLPIKIDFQGQSLHLFRSVPIFLSSFGDAAILNQPTINHLLFMQVVGFLATMVIFSCVLMIFVPFGQILGQILEKCENPMKAYSINIAASILGIWCFNALSFFYTPPWVWWILGIALIGILVACLPRQEADFSGGWANFLSNQRFWTAVAFIISLSAVGLMISQSSLIYKNKMAHGMTVWSPYQKLTLSPYGRFNKDPFETINFSGYQMQVNDVGFIDLLNLSDPFIRVAQDYLHHPVYSGQPTGKLNKFNLPYHLKKDAQSVLILGGGAGNDAAGALRAGLKRIDVVEIDPSIYQLGVRYHPEQPYSDSRVRVFVDDARAFLKKTKNRYDIVYFGLLDAHSQSSAMSSIRMDQYVYTKESFQEAKELLNKDGVFVITYWVQRYWVAERIRNVIKETFGWDPIVISVGANEGLGPVMMISGHDRRHVIDLVKNNDPVIEEYVSQNLVNYKVGKGNTTDDWPYLYLRSRKIPDMYLCVIAVIVALFLIGKGFLLGKKGRLELHFFFLGAAFLLLEFQNINKTSLLFGMTWIVNSINISMILFLILMANFCVQRLKIKDVRWAYALLFLSLLVNFFIPLGAYNIFNYWLKSFLASIMLNLPIFFAGIIFAVSFVKCPNRSLAFGSNLIGAVAGGLLEVLAFITGIRMLVVVTTVLYGFSLVFKKR